jgi:hypothetical protein
MMMIFWVMTLCSLEALKMETVCFTETLVYITRIEETENEYKLFFGSLQWKKQLGDLGVGGKIMLKWILKK